MILAETFTRDKIKLTASLDNNVAAFTNLEYVSFIDALSSPPSPKGSVLYISSDGPSPNFENAFFSILFKVSINSF